MQSVVFFDMRPDEPTTQILGLFGFWELKQRNADHNGIDHIKFYHRSLGELFDRVERLLDAGFMPYRSANHGPDSSFYFWTRIRTGWNFPVQTSGPWKKNCSSFNRTRFAKTSPAWMSIPANTLHAFAAVSRKASS